MKLATRLLSVSLALLLAGCSASMQQRIAACKAGDWRQIGQTDGADGAPPNFAERKEFCEGKGGAPAAADSQAHYTAGWQQGNAERWSAAGLADGAHGALSQFAVLAASDDVRKRRTPPNPAAYDEGWLKGNALWWEGHGKRAGVAGEPLASGELHRSNASATGLRFDEAAYGNGWRIGNRQFWQDAGTNDASTGIPDSELAKRAAAARAAGVQVQDDVYRAAWNGEIINYWRNLGARDAVSGMEFGVRGREARQKGLKVHEAEYRQAWEKRLAEYWRQAGLEDGDGKPYMLEQRIANARRDGVFSIPGTRDWYTQGWQEQNARYCVVDNAFERGRTNAGMAVEVCNAALQNALKRAYLSGQDYAAAAVRQRHAMAEAQDIEGRLYDGNRRLERIERELRNNQPAKDKPVSDDTAKQNRRREAERRELIDYLRRLDRELDDARRWVELHGQNMARLRREIY